MMNKSTMSCIGHFFVIILMMTRASITTMAQVRGIPSGTAKQRGKRLDLSSEGIHRLHVEAQSKLLEDAADEAASSSLLLSASGSVGASSSSKTTKTTTISDSILTIELDQTPMFLCDNNNDCRSAAKLQQDDVIAQIRAVHPDAVVLSQNYKLVNAVFIKVPSQQNTATNQLLKSIQGVKSVLPHTTYYPMLEATVEHIGAAYAQEVYCATGKGVKVAVLDSGIDYTHEALGGPGTNSSYQRAYGRNVRDIRNRIPDGFPTERVIGGIDFLGDTWIGPDTFPVRDDDPIDAFDGHGTYVASNIAAVAPDVQFLAVKVCGTEATAGCPGFALVSGIEYAVDPNDDGSFDDKVDIINLSLGALILSAYYDMPSLALENAFQLGVLPVVAAGNARDIPYIIGTPAGTANAITVAATGHPNSTRVGIMEFYSSRGPGVNNRLKPEISAPSRSVAATAGTGNGYRSVAGTSFSAPITAGAAALLIEKCPACSPLAIKALLMNNAERRVRYTNETDAIAPVSFMGAGEVRINASLQADFWAYSSDEGDVQPSLSLGLVDAAEDVVIRRTIVVKSLTNVSQQLDIDYAFRDPNDETSGALTIILNPSSVLLDGCSDEVSFDIEFRVDASKAPPNFLSSGGEAGGDPNSLNRNEFDGHILVKSAVTGKEIGLPFLMLLRQASLVNVPDTTIPSRSSFDSETTTTRVTLENVGAGIAQIDAFTLLGTSEDDPEAEHGEEEVPGDLRAVGYRTLEVGEPECSYVLEVAVALWERREHLIPVFPIVVFDVNGDNLADYGILPSGLRNSTTEVVDVTTPDTQRKCTGFPVDHATNAANVVLRVCAEDIELSLDNPQSITMAVIVQTIPSEEDYTDVLGDFRVRLPGSSLTAPSVDIYPGEVLEDFIILDEPHGTFSDNKGRGMMLMTNSFRREGRTGSATADTETILVLREGVVQPQERTPDDEGEVFPDAEDTSGPQCEWDLNFCLFPTASPTTPSPDTSAPTVAWSLSPTVTAAPTAQPVSREDPLRGPTCDLIDVPRLDVPTKSPTMSPAPSVEPSDVPSASPTVSKNPTTMPTTVELNSPPPFSSGVRSRAACEVFGMLAVLLLVIM